jgi:hypothetical protein
VVKDGFPAVRRRRPAPLRTPVFDFGTAMIQSPPEHHDMDRKIRKVRKDRQCKNPSNEVQESNERDAYKQWMSTLGWFA